MTKSNEKSLRTMPADEAPFRVIQSERPFAARRFFLQWEWLLVVLLVAINGINSFLSPYYLDYNNILSAISIFLDKAVVVFPMMLVILLGDIDISVSSIIALSGVSIGLFHNAGLPMGVAIVLGLLVGALCGLVNGLLIVKFKGLSSVIVTIATMTLYRGIASILLEDRAVGDFPQWFQFFGWGKIGTLPFILIFVAIEALAFGFLIHKTPLGRRFYATGSNPVAARFSGIVTDKLKILSFTLTGLFSAVASVFLLSKMGSARPSIAQGYELDIIAMVVLGGVSTAGGKGNVIGVTLSIFIIGLLRYGLGIVNVPSQTIMIIVGLLLVITVAVPNLKSSLKEMLPQSVGLRLFKKQPPKIKKGDVKL